MKVSVIIPTYNRAHLLEKIIPSYFQKNVGEVIIVNDSSTDNTIEILEKLKKKYKEKFCYISLNKNMRQVVAKNKGLLVAKFEYVYFGDDDSYIEEKSIENMLETMEKFKCSCVAARAVYLNSNDEFIIKKEKKLYDLNTLSTNWSIFQKQAIKIQIAPACVLLKTSIAKKISFDENYRGNCFREETDFALSLTRSGEEIYFDSRAIQINLPRIIATGGAHSFSKLNYEMWAIRNNWYFLKKHWEWLSKNEKGLNNKTFFQIKFIIKRLNVYTPIKILKFIVKKIKRGVKN